MRDTSQLLLALLLVSPLSGCSSTDKHPLDGPDKFVPIEMQAEEPIGKFLTDFDNRMRYWTNVVLTARNEREYREARQLESILGVAATRRLGELVVELETGPPRNRQRAAAALGFSHSPEALSPLVNALADPDPDVVHNALLGLTLLGFSETPTSGIVTLLEVDADPETRSNAASALRTFVEAGLDPEPFLPQVRRALLDPSGGVRVQCALLVGLAGDEESVETLGDMLHAPEALVTNASAEALLLIGQRNPSARGQAARALVGGWRKADNQLRSRLRLSLIELAGIDYGDDVKPWVEWSQRLP